MDAIGIFELGAKAGRGYVRAIRQAYRDAKAIEPQSDYYASGLGVAEEGGEALEPDCWADYDYTPRKREPAKCGKCGNDMILRHVCAPAAPTPEPRMESDGPDATQPLAPTPSDMCVCGHTLYVHWTRCDVASHYEVDDCLCAGFRLAVSPVPSSSAGRGVGSPGVSAGAEEPAPPGKRTAVTAVGAIVAEVLAEHEVKTAPFGQYFCLNPNGELCEVTRRCGNWDYLREYREHVADEVQSRIDAGVGATPTPKPAEPQADDDWPSAAKFFPQYQNRKGEK